MKYTLLTALLLLVSANHALALSFTWGIDGSATGSPLTLNGAATTRETFNPYYSLQLMCIGKAPTSFSSSRGYPTFLLADTADHTKVPGAFDHSATIPDGTGLNGRQYLPVLYEKATGKHFFLSETENGPAITPYTIAGYIYDEISPIPYSGSYYPISQTGKFYKGAEIPPFCGWLSQYDLTENDLTNIPTNLVNLAFAVDANPTDFSDVALSITELTISPTSLSGTFVFNAKNAADMPTAVTKLNDPASFVIRTSDSLSAPFSTPPSSSVSLETNTFEVDATPSTQFLRLDLTPAKLW